ncbi:hypothetical protein B0H14DRAFT_3496047 [Mycena olivaceomarginata]|nr:hypothetical protein B0H14DRAFT_3496047 [Mycena olivaceomarginata]
MNHNISGEYFAKYTFSEPPGDVVFTDSQIITGFMAIFALCWMGLIQKVQVCASNKSWYKEHNPPQCHVGKGVAALELVTDVFADGTLAILPIALIRHAIVPTSQRKMLIVIFAACVLTTLVSIVHAYFLLGPGSSFEGIAVQAQAATAFLVANAGVLATSVYRLFHKSDDIASMPYTYKYSTQHDGDAQTSDGSVATDSTEMVEYEKSTGSKVDG